MAETTSADPRRLSQLVVGLWQPQALYAAAELGVADCLAAGPLPAAAVARRLGTDADATARLLQALVTLDLCCAEGDGFALSPLGECLTADSPASLRSVVRLMAGPEVWSAWSRLVDCVRTGRPADDLDGTGDPSKRFIWLEDNPEAAAIFHQAMVEWTRQVAPGIVAAIDFGDARRVVDVGGGYGALLCAALAANPQLEGAVFDLPHAEAGARRLFDAQGVAARAGYHGGDMFADALPAADAYLLKSVIHDWDDAHSLRILRRCREAMAGGARLLLIEPPAPDGPADPAAAWILTFSDLNMLVNTGGRERTAAQYGELLQQAGLRVVAEHATTSFFRLFDAVRD